MKQSFSEEEMKAIFQKTHTKMQAIFQEQHRVKKKKARDRRRQRMVLAKIGMSNVRFCVKGHARMRLFIIVLSRNDVSYVLCIYTF